MYIVKITNNHGKLKEWDVFYDEVSANRERDLLISEHDFWPDDVFVEKFTN